MTWLDSRAVSGFAGSASAGLSILPEFGSNPGALVARTYIPDGLTDQAPLVVVLHGCTQTAAEYDRGAGWSALADRHRFALLFPEQQRCNNANLCFNWFEPGDMRRGAGEALSIRQMVEQCVVTHRLDRRRVHITGLSAGGAMTSVMLATYPEVFAGGAIIAGLPYGCAASIPQAFDRMRGHGLPGDRELQRAVRAASTHAGPWPTISIWHGSADQTVSPANGEAIIAQWRALLGVAALPDHTDLVDGYPRRVWCDANGRERMEAYGITGMGHGTPLDTAGEYRCGVKGPYMLDAGISSTRHILRFWGMVAGEEAASARAAEVPPSFRRPGAPPLPPAPGHQTGISEIRRVIDTALRAAGLLR